jgi:hypothetical protein
LCRSEICFLKSREEHSWRVCESREVRRIFGVGERKELRGAERFCSEFMTVTVHQILI